MKVVYMVPNLRMLTNYLYIFLTFCIVSFTDDEESSDEVSI